MTSHRTVSEAPLKAVAVFEGFKGALSLLAATGLLALAHTDLHVLAVRLVAHAHLNPASKYPGIFLDAVNSFPNTRTLLLALGAALYALVRGAEAYGLYRGRAWAAWLAAGSGALYVPFEVYELVHRPSWLALSFLLVNLAVVALMVRALRQRLPRGDNGPQDLMPAAPRRFPKDPE